MLYPLSYRGAARLIVLCRRPGFQSHAPSTHGCRDYPEKDKRKGPHLLGRAVGAISEEEDMTLTRYRLPSTSEYPGGRIVTSCDFFVGY